MPYSTVTFDDFLKLYNNGSRYDRRYADPDELFVIDAIASLFAELDIPELVFTLATNVGAGTTNAVTITKTGRYKLFIQGTFGASGLIELESEYGEQTGFQDISAEGGIPLDAPGNSNYVYLAADEQVRAVITDVTGCYIQLVFIGA